MHSQVQVYICLLRLNRCFKRRSQQFFTHVRRFHGLYFVRVGVLRPISVHFGQGAGIP